jgi:four helix bundle protein
VKRKHHDLLAWQEAIKLVKATYTLTQAFPREELFGLTAQMRRAAISVPSNIAEGAARASAKEFVHFLILARGSLSELETQLVIARELSYVAGTTDVDTLMDRVFRLIAGLISSNKAVKKP